ncbi:unnamed protein product [Dimorphilus gyrociliatus]|uniref:Phosphatidylserine decarboxylase proenzyme, mitochondrial n=1 Tax=Dimorphilus gyrociliatus TaxID=2664684 RepID=A0A7I8VC61_9ANNE|nr:unnamed protein product [Dimorphilus gyrociliatus]
MFRLAPYIVRIGRGKLSPVSPNFQSAMRQLSQSPKEERLIFKWFKPMSFGILGCICYLQFFHVVEREQKKYDMDLQFEGISVKLYKFLPLSTLSRVWGFLNNLTLPVFLREPILKLYINTFSCNLSEAAIRDLTYYKNLAEFFRRKLRPEVRPIDKTADLVSPSDGRILHFGSCSNGNLEQVKGVKFRIFALLGKTELDQRLKEENVDLYYCTIYLAPGDYHRFHAPADWQITFRRHFPGKLLSVSAIIARKVRGLFTINERVVYTGHWKHGFFGMIPIGATNVGNIKIYHDKELRTNLPKRFLMDQNPESTTSVEFKKGDHFGEFNLGSSIILVFEAPKNFKFAVNRGEKIKMGQKLGQ